MASESPIKAPRKARAGKRAGSSGPIVDEATRARAETELRNHLAGRDVELAAAVLARVAGTTAASEKKNVEEWYAIASLTVCDEVALGARIEAMDRTARVALCLLARAPWWSRTTLVQAIALASGDDPADESSLSRALGEVLARWPVLVRTNAWTRAEELSLFEPLAVRARPLLKDELAIGRVAGEPPPPADLRRTLLALALFPGLVAQRRPRVTRVGELHGADAAKLERTLGDARGLFATWERLRAFEEVDGALSPIAARVRALLGKPQAIAIEYVRAQLGDLGWSLATIAAQAGPGERVELGASLIAIGLARNFEYGFDVATLTSFLERDAFRFAPLMLASAKEDAIALPIDVRAALRGELTSSTVSGAGGYVQPSYEVMLTPEAPLEAAFILGCAAELTHFEAVARLELKRESVVAARALGIETREIVAALEAIAGTRGIPPAVRAAIDEWGDAIGEARVRTAIVFEVRGSEALLTTVASELGTIVLDRPAPHLFLLSRAPSPRELAQLRAAGVLTRSVSST
ncbi:MAG: helicase-associated domain-containing protein, partial [Polyangiales bacterium]